MVKNFSLIVMALIIVFSGCSNKNNYSRKPITNILITPANKVVEQGNDFTVKTQTSVKNGKLQKVDLFIDNELIESTDKAENTIKVSTKKYLPGNHTIKAVAYKTDGISSANTATFFIPSDIVPEKLSFKIIKTLAHDPSYFTQGFEFVDEVLYEGTGNEGTSFIFSYIPGKNKIIKSLKLDNKYFGEGITILNNKIYQLTYKHKIGFVYDSNTFEKINEFSFVSNEGWGLCNDGKNLIMSDGSSKIHYIDPINFSIINSIEVCDNQGTIDYINELEYVDGIIYANIWTKNTILKIDANTGKVLAYINMEPLLAEVKSSAFIDVLNGIAYNRKENLFYITGKLWPKMFAVKFTAN